MINLSAKWEQFSQGFEKPIPPNLVTAALGLKPQEAIAYFRNKGYAITWDWKKQLELNNAQSFTVAKAMKMDVLQDIRKMTQKALDDGITFQQFQKDLKPQLQARGWWGKKEVVGPNGRKVVQLGSSHRLRTIYETNTQSAYNAGRWRGMDANSKNRPFIRYVTAGDAAVRPEHAALNGTVKPIGSPFWNTYWPPNSYNCRCKTRALTPAEMKQEGGLTKGLPRVKEGPKKGEIARPKQGFRQNPGKEGLFFRPEKKGYDNDIWQAGQPIVPVLAIGAVLAKVKPQETEEDDV